ncbi:signal transducer and activator of transcription 1-like isoform X3 [Boleophthalmus pectinirostris]|uniref:signal transducer and activator of transcription 1-like isoform X3 n=1 Tax=Boleophthalmus pectinirostris TaxID=150288 RepID=UPI0024311B06|nr:signal transducer and activator of transcription 1-like isoform X3 [Boleophthalmus pectinirostris]
MAQWQELLKLEPDSKSRVCRLYARKFPIDVRRCLGDWVEGQDWELAAEDEATARTHFLTLLRKLDKLIKESHYNNHTLTGPDFSLLKSHMLTQFEHCPKEMAIKLSECLQEEKKILDSCAINLQRPTVTEETDTDLDIKVSELKTQTKEIEEEIKVLEKVESVYKEWESEVQRLNGLATTQMQEKFLNQAKSIRTKQQEVVTQIVKLVNFANKIVQTLVSVEIPEWKRKQQMSCIGNPVFTGLEHLEKWFSAVAESLLQIVQQVKKLRDQSRPQISAKSDLSQVIQQISSLIKELLKNALVVEKQPMMYSQTHRPLVLRTNVHFSVKLRLLVNLPILQNGCLIRAEFDKGVEEIKTIPGFRQFQFTCKDTKVMDKQNEGLVAEWDMSISENKSKRKRSNESPIKVTEELHIIKFSTDLWIAGLQCKAETSSLPLVVVSTTSQGPSAWASVLWSNLCPPENMTLSLFLDPPSLSWEQLSQALSWQFISAGDRELNEDQLNELKLKIVDNPDLVSWSKFSNKEGPWIWIDGILDLIEKHLKNLWRDGCIMGFVSKENTRDLLLTKQVGNFLLRFSESNREGAITFSWSEYTTNEITVRAIDPFSKDELSRTSLADTIKTYRTKRNSNNPLIYLFPDQPKDDVFKRYYSESNNNQSVGPYLKRTYVCEGDCPTPPSCSPPLSFSLHTQMDLDQYWGDIPTPPPMLSSPSFEKIKNDLVSDMDLDTSDWPFVGFETQ